MTDGGVRTTGDGPGSRAEPSRAALRRGDKVWSSMANVVESARRDAEEGRRLTADTELSLDQAAGFARGGDFLGAQARARFADQQAVLASPSLRATDPFLIAIRAHIDASLRRYDSLVREWQLEVEARHKAYVARERQAIGADPKAP